LSNAFGFSLALLEGMLVLKLGSHIDDAEDLSAWAVCAMKVGYFVRGFSQL
jgi:hypothetical protein